MYQFLKFILFWNNTLHVSDGLSVHHQESKTVHTATSVCQTDTVTCLLAGTRFEKLVHLVGFTTEIYYDARSYKRQICIVIYYITLYIYIILKSYGTTVVCAVRR